MENKLIRFHETELVTFIDPSGKPFVAVKPICDAIGLKNPPSKKVDLKLPL